MKKISLWGNIEGRLDLQAIIFLHQLTSLKDMKGTFFRFHESKRNDPIMVATTLFGNIINIQPFEDGNRRISRLTLAHVLT